MDMTQSANCTFCDTKIAGFKIFGPARIPTCWDCYKDNAERIEEISQYFNHEYESFLGEIAMLKADIIGGASPHGYTITKKIKKLERQIEDLEIERDLIDDQIRDAEGDIHKLKQKLVDLAKPEVDI